MATQVPYPEDDRRRFDVWLPVGLKDRLKHQAWQQRRTLRDVVIEAFEKWLSWQESLKVQEPGKEPENMPPSNV